MWVSFTRLVVLSVSLKDDLTTNGAIACCTQSGDGHADDPPPPPPSSIDGTKPSAPSGDHAREGTLLAQHDNCTSDAHG